MAKKIKSKIEESNSDDITVYIGKKDNLVYIKSCLYILKKSNNCAIKSRYGNFLTAIDVYFEVCDFLESQGKVLTTTVSLWLAPYTDKNGRDRMSKEMMIDFLVNNRVDNEKVVKDVKTVEG